MDRLIYFIMVPMVYVAFAVFGVGTIARLTLIFRAPRYPSTLRIYPVKKPGWLYALGDTFLFPTVRKHNPLLWLFLVAFHLCILLLMVGHLELFGEIGLERLVAHEIFLGGGFVGLVTLVALLYLLFRRFRSPVREISVPEDYYLLILLFLVALFGSQMDWARRWYGYDSINVEHYRAYLSSLILLRPELPSELTDMGHSFMIVLHVFFANLFLIFFPFSQSLHAFLALPVNKLRRG